MTNINKNILIKNSFNYCSNITKNHYENFPVASKLLPKKLRSPIIAIYTYARYADDIVDSNILNQKQKSKLINELERIIENIDKVSYLELKKLTDKNLSLSFLSHLKDSINKHNISINLLLHLLIAFKQDIIKNKYSDFQELLYYCKYSANPIGRLLLNLNNVTDKKSLIASDNICSALQIINFMQDIKSDYIERKRCYIPVDIIEKYNLNLSDIISNQSSLNWIKAREEILEQAYKLIIKNKQNLLKNLSGRFKLEIKAIIEAALYLINKFKNNNFTQDNIFQRPYLSKLDFIKIFIRALFHK